MPQVVRQSVFETNSSSTHSITIKGGKFVSSKFPTEGGICKVYPDKFRWNQEWFRDPATKASYCLTYAKQVEDPKLLEMLRKLLADTTGCEVDFVEEDDEYSPWGDIDHQSCGVCGEAFESEEALHKFIFNPSSVLKIDNDNH